MSNLIYMNSAAIGQPEPRVYARLQSYLAREMEIGPFLAMEEVQEELLDARSLVAKLINAAAAQIAFTTSATHGWAAAVASLRLQGKRVLLAQEEWCANIEILKRLPGGSNLVFELIPRLSNGDVDLEKLQNRIDDDVALICLPMISSLTGHRHLVEEVGQLQRPENCNYFVDAAQALGQIPVNCDEMNCDVLVAPFRKWLRGPKTAGILYVSEGCLHRMQQNPAPGLWSLQWDEAQKSFFDLDDARRFEAYDPSVFLRLAAKQAVEVVQDIGIEDLSKRLLKRADYIRDRLEEFGVLSFKTGSMSSAIVSFCLPLETGLKFEGFCRENNILLKFPEQFCEPMNELFNETEQRLIRLSPHVDVSDKQINDFFHSFGVFLNEIK